MILHFSIPRRQGSSDDAPFHCKGQGIIPDDAPPFHSRVIQDDCSIFIDKVKGCIPDDACHFHFQGGQGVIPDDAPFSLQIQKVSDDTRFHCRGHSDDAPFSLPEVKFFLE
ncbi:hypothetical protein AVEN_222871-1 [Araneus ventricosus]|uniref:Uncharacterized protein n=1 Tax=Araneus ventricosus TaxID=182803 RepID=A0A4Y2T5Z5_ARAVE|nr:hypothetical protein AVEN_222871-1 [Araneus ventricosus]